MDGVYGLVRHPLYFFSLLVLWFTPQMTLHWLVFVILATVYFLVGSRLRSGRCRSCSDNRIGSISSASRGCSRLLR